MNYKLYFTLIISILFQSFPLIKGIGNIGYSITSFILPIVTILYFVNIRKVKLTYNKKMIFLLIVLTITSCLSNLIYIFNGNDLVVLSENIVVKSIKILVYFGLGVLFSIIVFNLMENLSIEEICKPFSVGYFILAFILFFELTFRSLYTKIFQSGLASTRIRLTTLEPSFTGGLIVVFFSVTLYYFCYVNTNKLMTGITLVIGVLFAIFSSSKGFYLILLLSLIVMSIYSKKKKIIFSSLFFILLFSLIFGGKIIAAIKGDMLHDTSIATRSYTSYVGILYMIQHPFGTGGGVFLNYYPKMLLYNLEDFLSFFQSHGVTFKTKEIDVYLSFSSDKSIASKISIIQYGMYWGIVGTGIFLAYLKGVINEAKKINYILFYPVIFCILGICTYYPIDFKYEIWAIFQLAFVVAEKQLRGGELCLKK